MKRSERKQTNQAESISCCNGASTAISDSLLKCHLLFLVNVPVVEFERVGRNPVGGVLAKEVLYFLGDLAAVHINEGLGEIGW